MFDFDESGSVDISIRMLPLSSISKPNAGFDCWSMQIVYSSYCYHCWLCTLTRMSVAQMLLGLTRDIETNESQLMFSMTATICMLFLGYFKNKLDLLSSKYQPTNQQQIKHISYINHISTVDQAYLKHIMRISNICQPYIPSIYQPWSSQAQRLGCAVWWPWACLGLGCRRHGDWKPMYPEKIPSDSPWFSGGFRGVSLIDVSSQYDCSYRS